MQKITIELPDTAEVITVNCFFDPNDKDTPYLKKSRNFTIGTKDIEKIKFDEETFEWSAE